MNTNDQHQRGAASPWPGTAHERPLTERLGRNAVGDARGQRGRMRGRWELPLIGLLLPAISMGCAEGGETPPPYATAEANVEGFVQDEPETTEDDATDNLPAATGAACELEDDPGCDCDHERINGRRTCIFDDKSSLYGFWSDCGGCFLPTAPATVSDAGDAGMDAGLVDAGDADVAVLEKGASCDDDSKNGTETDVDCGGDDCDACALGAACVQDEDCEERAVCQDDVCTAGPSSTFRNYDHASYEYTKEINWNCNGTTRFDSSGDGSWTQTSDCSNTEDTQPDVTCDVEQTSPDGPKVCILHAASLTIGMRHTLELVGERPVIIAVDGNATVSGTIDASARGAVPGAGGNVSCDGSAGSNGGGNITQNGGASGGGGGGNSTAGGNGGAANTNGNDVAGGEGGAARAEQGLSPLTGGCPGGQAGDCDDPGGGGGGALQISAGGTMNIIGTLRANGADGQTPCGDNGTGGGTGGGAGGAILLEGRTVNFGGDAAIRVSGGDGGENGDEPEGGVFSNACGSSDGGDGSNNGGEPGAAGTDCEGGGSGGGGGRGQIGMP